MSFIFLFAILLAVLFALAPGLQGTAQSDLMIQTDTAGLDFPNKLAFTLAASIVDEVTGVFLIYGTQGRSCVEGIARQEADLVLGDPFQASWEWDFKDSGSLPPGVEIWWYWEVFTRPGRLITTARQSLVIEDPHLDWQKIEEDQITVVWAEGSQSFARRILTIARIALDRMEKEVGIRPDGKIRLTVYPTFETLRDAVLFMPEWTGGIAFPRYAIIMLAIPSDSGDWMEEVIPHELTHLLTGEKIFNCLGNDLPTWLDEGLSVFSETATSQEDAAQVRRALEAGTLPLLRNLAAGFPADEEQASLSYAQSGEIVHYIIKEYGPEKMSALLSAFQTGLLINPALQQVYGMDTDALENVWRISLGFPGASAAGGEVAPTLARTSVPTLALWTPAFGRATPTSPALERPVPTGTPSPFPLAEVVATTTLLPCSAGQTCPPAVEPGPTITTLPVQSPSVLPCLGTSMVIACLFLFSMGLSLMNQKEC
jgi:hypothetical protein